MTVIVDDMTIEVLEDDDGVGGGVIVVVEELSGAVSVGGGVTVNVSEASCVVVTVVVYVRVSTKDFVEASVAVNSPLLESESSNVREIEGVGREKLEERCWLHERVAVALRVSDMVADRG